MPKVAAWVAIGLMVPSLACSITCWMLGDHVWIHLGNAGLLVGFVLAAVAWSNLDRERSRRLRAVVSFCLGLYGLAIVAMWFLIGYAPVVHGHHRMRTSNNLKQIAEAMHAHAEKHDNRFPPAALRDGSGKPLLSWRVLLLPYLGEEELYKEFRLDEPWDSDHNFALLGRMPKVYSTVYPDRIPPFTTRLQVFVGPGTPFEIEKGPHVLDDFPDGPSGTILVVEAREPVPWTKPADLVYSPDGSLPDLGMGWKETQGQLYRPHPGQFGLAFADGSARSFHRNYFPSEDRLRYLIVRNDGKGWIDGP